MLIKLAEEKVAALASSKSKLMRADRNAMKPWLAHALDTVTEDWRVLLTEGRAGWQKYAKERKRKASGAPHESDEHDSEELEEQEEQSFRRCREAPEEPWAAVIP